MDNKNSPQFKYHPNVYDSEVVTFGKAVCQCCGQEISVYIETMYCVEEIECICLECVANGEAAKKYNGQFVQDAEAVDNKEKYNELFYRTPGYISWQGEHWLSCCNDYCAFIGDVGTKELEDMGIADDVFQEYDARNEYEDVRLYLEKEGSLAGYLFKCLHCGKYHIWVDAD